MKQVLWSAFEQCGRMLVALTILTAEAVTTARAGDPVVTAVSPVQSVVVEGSVLKITLSDGRLLTSSDLIGANLLIDQGGHTLRVRLEDIERDPSDKRAGVAAADTIWLHRFAVEGPDGTWQPLCEDGPDGRRQAIPLAGRFSAANGRFEVDGSSRFELACTAGAMGKCVRFGYRPWQIGDLPEPVPQKNVGGGAATASRLDLYNACIRMVRADYGGNGVSTTRTGMIIDLYDDLGIQSPSMDPGMTFEAGWTQDGAVCVNHPRVKENVSLGDIEVRWPHLAGKTGTSCTEEAARAMGALLYNSSAP